MTYTARVRSMAMACVFMLLLAALLVLDSARASAHDPLQSSSPAAEETITEELPEVILTFANEPLANVPSVIQVSDPAGNRVDDDNVTSDGRSLTVRVSPTMTGVYSVIWQTVSSDAHTISDEFTFTYSGPVPEPSRTPTTDASPPPAPESPAPADRNDASETEVAGNQTQPFVPLIVAVLALVLITVILAAVRAARARARHTAPTSPVDGPGSRGNSS